MRMQIENPIQHLRREHDEALEVLGRLEVALRSLPAPSALDTVQQSIAFLDEEVRGHNQREEECLFPVLETVLPPAGPTAVMRTEHREFWSLLQALGAACREVPLQPLVTQETGLMLVDLLRRHINKENRILFVMAQQLLSPEAMAQVARKMEERLAAEERKEQYVP